MPGTPGRSSDFLTARQSASGATNYTGDDEFNPTDTPSWGLSLYKLLSDSILALDA